MKKSVLLTALFGLVLGLPASAAVEAAEFCVSGPVEMQTALYTATINGEDDVIKVRQGTYSGYDFYASFNEPKDISVLGGYTKDCAGRVLDPSNTIIDGGKMRQGLVLIQYGSGNIKVEGLTIRNGENFGGGIGDGGGLYVLCSSSPRAGAITVTRMIVRDSVAAHEGGGIYAVSQSNPSGAAGNITVSHTLVAGNTASGSEYASGGGIHAVSYSFQGHSGHVRVTHNTVSGNSSVYGGGIYAFSYGPSGPGNVTVEDNTVTGNTAGGGRGGGIYADSSAATFDSGFVSLSRNILSGNTATAGSLNEGKGGGAYAGTTSATSGNSGKVSVTDNTVSGNQARSGGGLFLESSAYTGTAGTLELSANTVSGNRATSGGGGVFAISVSNSGQAGIIQLINNVLTGNDAGEFDQGGGLWARTYSISGKAGDMALIHNTIAGNRANLGPGIYLRLEKNTAHLYNNIVRGNGASLPEDIVISGTGMAHGLHNNYEWIYGTWTTSGNNLNADPLFRDPGLWDDPGTPTDVSDDAWVEGDYNLQAGSPCIDQGYTHAPLLPATDKDGKPRMTGAGVDMGAYEFAACLPFLKDLSLILPCIQYSTYGFSFKLVYYPNPADPANFYWKLDPGSLQATPVLSDCISLAPDFSLKIPCAEYLGTEYAFTFLIYPNPEDPTGVYWKMDVGSVTLK